MAKNHDSWVADRRQTADMGNTLRRLFLLVFVLTCFTVHSQDSSFNLMIIVRNAENKEPLAGATASIPQLQRIVRADSLGVVVFERLAGGTYQIAISYVGFEEQRIKVTVPQLLFEVLLEVSEEGEEEIIIQATRTSRTIANTPTRIEVISGEELAEKGNMRPGNIQMLLNESTGIQTQVTSATSANASIRIQGLDGRYTQILKDGFPLYAGFSGGLSIMQIPPLDLRQVEVIKGSSSTLYGGGAIAGLVNLVSKLPGEKRELSFLGNATTAGGFDLSGFYSEKYGKIGSTVFISRNSGMPYDPAGIGLTAIPSFERYTVNPRLFFYGKRTSANVGFSYAIEDRVGGSIDYIKNNRPGYYEQNNTDRFTTQVSLTHRISDRAVFNVKSSYNRFLRNIEIPAYRFQGVQQSGFSELTYSNQGTRSEWVLGLNMLTDKFDEEPLSADPLRNYSVNTYGLFVQNQWSPVYFFTLETGMRLDHVDDLGLQLLPRFSAMLRFSPDLTVRIGGGLGYKTPTVFNEEAERIQFRGIRPINISIAENERSVGSNLDINYRRHFGDLGFSLNHLFFYTRLNRPLILTDNGGELQFVNTAGYMDTRGMETNVRLTYGDWKLFAGYTYADVNTHYNGQKEWFTLTTRHRLNNVLMYEKDEKWKAGLEAYYFSPQRLSDGAMGRPYWIMGLMGERSWESFSLFVNLENFTDSRQTRFDTIFTGSVADPTFRDVYAPMEGFIANGGVKLRL